MMKSSPENKFPVPTSPERNLAIVVLIGIYILMFWSSNGDFRPGRDSMTYGAVAKQIARTGDWLHFHYSSQAYADFYQQPPLGIWLLAATMKLFGTADWVLKSLTSVFAAGCAITVYRWAKKIRGEWFAFVACFILLTSLRFVKYSKGFMMDPLLATFAVWGIYFLQTAVEGIRKFGGSAKSFSTLFFAGICVGGAFLSKGMFAFAPLIAGFMIIAYHAATDGALRRKGLLLNLLWFTGTLFPIGIWFLVADAGNYLQHYWLEAVVGRVGHYSLREHLEPLNNLLHVYWPWLPFFLLGTATLLKKHRLRLLATSEGAALLTACGFLGGFVLVASYLEQYMTAFYPFAALVAATGVPAVWERYRRGITRGLAGLILAVALTLWVKPHALSGDEYRNPFRILLAEASNRCRSPEIRGLAISTGVAEIWYALSLGGWYTNWDTRSEPSARSPRESGSQLLLAGNGETVHPDWQPTDLIQDGLRIYRSRGVTIDCEKTAPAGKNQPNAAALPVLQR